MQIPAPGHSPRFLPLLAFLFVASGCAALIYEIVWFQMLELVIGSTAVSLAVLLATFMGGMCAGSLFSPRLVSPQRHPLRVYALLECGIALTGLLVFFLLPIAGDLYAIVAGDGFTGVAMRELLAAILLLPPTFMMGATLPVIARWLESVPRGVAWLGLFYGGNIVGAVSGCILAGFYLLRVHDMAFATYVAIGINLAAAMIAWTIARAAPHRVAVTASSTERGRVPGSVPVYVSIALSGFCALSAELVWTRNLSLLMGGTVYTFSVILAVFLAGLGIGSTIGSSVSGSIRHGDSARARVLLAACQLFQAAAIVWAAIGIGAILPYWPIDGTLTVSAAINLHMDVMRAAAALLPAAILWGASFPFALAAVSLPGVDAGRTVGRVYAANTIGAILGSLITALLLIPALGTTQTQQLLTAVTMVSALAATLPGIVPASRAAWQGSRTALYAAGLVFVVLLGNWLVRQVPGLPWPLVAYGRQIPFTSIDGVQPLYIGEGLHSSVGVTETAQGVRSFHVAGKTEASTLAKDMRLQRMLGHIPALFHPEPKSVLVVGLGAGVTAGSFLTHPSVERIVVCEIEPLVPQQIAPYFSNQNYDIVNDPRVEIVYDDARHYIRTTQEKFDVITSDPIHPWVKGAATLYTAEYFQMVKQRLKPGGVVTQWVPFYESSAEVVASELATFFDAFPEGTIWGNDDKGSGYDVVMFGQTGPLRIDVDQIERRLQVAPVRESLGEVNLDSIAQLMMTYAGRGRDLGEILGDAVINRDRTLRLQYMAGLQVNSSEGRRMYLPLLDLRQFPADLLIGSEQSLDALSVQMGLPRTTSP